MKSFSQFLAEVRGSFDLNPGSKEYQKELEKERIEAKQRKKEHLHSTFELVDLACYSDNQKIAMSSYIYNTGGHQLGLRGIIQRCDIAWVLYVMRNWGWSANWQVLSWLAKRRNIEINKFNSQ